jgi:hypothetical protein
MDQSWVIISTPNDFSNAGTRTAGAQQAVGLLQGAKCARGQADVTVGEVMGRPR